MPTNPQFIIGLGGIGNAVARLVYQRFLQTEGTLPDTVLIRSIDTANQVTDATGSTQPLPKNMFLRLEGFAANELVARREMYAGINRWWNYDDDTFDVGFIDNGAGARRPIGRLFVFHQFDRLYGALTDAFRKPLDVDLQNRLTAAGFGTVSKKPSVFVVGSLAGGTCSGMLLDTGFLVRELLRRVGYEASAINVTAVLALPSVIFTAMHDHTSGPARNMQINAFGALTEIDALQRGWEHGAFTLKYPNPLGEFMPTAPLFDRMYLFSANKKSGYQYARQSDILVRAAHFLYQQSSTDAAERLNQVTVNVPEYFTPTDRVAAGGLLATYAAFGVEWLEVPRSHLLRTWCERVAGDVARLVADLDWDQERARNLDNELQGRLPDGLRGIWRAAELLTMNPTQLASVNELRGLNSVLERIHAAEKPDELKRGLEDAESEIPRLVKNVRVALSRVNEREANDWIYELACGLIASSSFRVGGAKRVLSRFAEVLEPLSGNGSPVSNAPIHGVVDDCVTGMGPFKKVSNPEPAVKWVQQRIRTALQTEVSSVYGSGAARLATTCRKAAELLSQLSETIRRNAANLGQLIAMDDTPADTWLLDPADIDKAIEEHWQDVSSAAAESVANAIALRFEDDARVGAVRDEEYGKLFGVQAMLAIEREAIRHTKRPDNAVKRIQDRVVACEPLVRIDDEGPSFDSIMDSSMKASPVRLVLSEIEGDGRDVLESWVNEQAGHAGSNRSYQLYKNSDPHRDDVLYVTFGWPLWLMPEVRDCADTEKAARARNEKTPRFNRTHREVAVTRDHSFQPVDEDENRDLYGIALVLDHVRVGGTSGKNQLKITFDEGLLRSREDVTASQTEIVSAGYEAFRKRGLARKYQEYVQSSIESGDVGVWKAGGIEACGRKVARLEKGTGLPEAAVVELRRYYERAREFFERIVTL